MCLQRLKIGDRLAGIDFRKASSDPRDDARRIVDLRAGEELHRRNRNESVGKVFRLHIETGLPCIAHDANDLRPRPIRPWSDTASESTAIGPESAGYRFVDDGDAAAFPCLLLSHAEATCPSHRNRRR